MNCRALLTFFFLLLIPAVASAIAARDYRTTFYAHRADVDRCANGASGSFDLSLDVRPNGEAQAARVTRSDDPRMQTVGRCVLAQARRWHYSPSTSGGSRHYRFEFSGGSFSVSAIVRRRSP